MYISELEVTEISDLFISNVSKCSLNILDLNAVLALSKGFERKFLIETKLIFEDYFDYMSSKIADEMGGEMYDTIMEEVEIDKTNK